MSSKDTKKMEPWSEFIVSSIGVADCVRADLNFPSSQGTSPTYRRHSAPVVVETSRPMDSEPVSARSTASVASNGPQETVEDLQAQITELKRLEKTVKLIRASKEKRLKILKERAGVDTTTPSPLTAGRNVDTNLPKGKAANLAVHATHRSVSSSESIGIDDILRGSQGLDAVCSSRPESPSLVMSAASSTSGSTLGASSATNAGYPARRLSRGNVSLFPGTTTVDTTSVIVTPASDVFVSPISLLSPPDSARSPLSDRSSTPSSCSTNPPVMYGKPSQPAMPPPIQTRSGSSGHVYATLSSQSPAWQPNGVHPHAMAVQQEQQQASERRHSLQHLQQRQLGLDRPPLPPYVGVEITPVMTSPPPVLSVPHNTPVTPAVSPPAPMVVTTASPAPVVEPIRPLDIGYLIAHDILPTENRGRARSDPVKPTGGVIGSGRYQPTRFAQQSSAPAIIESARPSIDSTCSEDLYDMAAVTMAEDALTPPQPLAFFRALHNRKPSSEAPLASPKLGADDVTFPQ